jgi:hypothetical protein
MISMCHQFCRFDGILERDRWRSRSRTVREIAHDFETFYFGNYCKSFHISKLLHKPKRFSFNCFLSDCVSTKRLELINVGISARAPFGCIKIYL